MPSPFAIVAPDTLHSFEALGLVSHLFIEPESRAGRTLEQLMQGRSVAAMTAAQAQDPPSSLSALPRIRATIASWLQCRTTYDGVRERRIARASGAVEGRFALKPSTAPA